MIVKIPIYIEIEIRGDYDPSLFKQATEALLPDYINRVVQEYGNFPHTSEDILDELGRRFARRINVEHVKLSLISKSEIFRRVNDHR